MAVRVDGGDMHHDAMPVDATPADAATADARIGDAAAVDATAADAMPLVDAGPPDMGVVLGACCTVDGLCRLAEQNSCAAVGGRLTPNQTCEAVDCPAPTRPQLVEHALTLETTMRAGLGLYADVVGTIGREFWNLNGDDPVYTRGLLGRGELPLDSALVSGNYRALYRTVRDAVVLERMAGTVAELTPQERRATIGFAVTVQAFAISRVAHLFGDNGVLPVDALDDLANPRFLDHDDALEHVATLLDRAATELTAGGQAFPFGLSYGFDGFDTPATFRQFNRALTARIRIYQGDGDRAVGAIASSFFNINGDLNIGPRFGFGAADRNPLFHAPDVDRYTVHPATAQLRNAPRIARRMRAYTVERGAVSHDDLTGTHQLALVTFDTDPWPIIRNAELVLIYGEAQIGRDVNEVLAAINRVRNAFGQNNYLGATDNVALHTEIREQRRRSFFGEGHRWIDMRRAGRLGELPIDRRGDRVLEFLPRPDISVLQDP
jgi:hypothetical protein